MRITEFQCGTLTSQIHERSLPLKISPLDINGFSVCSGLKFSDPGVMIKVSLRKLIFDVPQIISIVI